MVIICEKLRSSVGKIGLRCRRLAGWCGRLGPRYVYLWRACIALPAGGRSGLHAGGWSGGRVGGRPELSAGVGSWCSGGQYTREKVFLRLFPSFLHRARIIAETKGVAAEGNPSFLFHGFHAGEGVGRTRGSGGLACRGRRHGDCGCCALRSICGTEARERSNFCPENKKMTRLFGRVISLSC